MYTWFSDLDNTLVYSHRTNFMEEKILVEFLNGKEQSYMTKKCFDFMCEMNLEFVPVTTRSIEQFNRLFVFKESIHVKYALVCNGAILLNNGAVDEEWVQETRNVAKKGIEDLEIIRNEFDEKKLIKSDEFMFYFKSDKPKEEALSFRKKYENLDVYIGYDKRKVYFLPKEINKGIAIKRYCKRFGIKKTISSGDSEFDIPMLKVTDMSMFPDILADYIDSYGEKHSLGKDLIIANALCDHLKSIIEENRNEFE